MLIANSTRAAIVPLREELTAKKSMKVERPRRREERRPHYLRDWRMERGWNLLEMAARINKLRGWHLTTATLSRTENNIMEYRQDLLEAYAEVLECTPADLLSREPYNPTEYWRAIQRAREALDASLPPEYRKEK